MADNTLKPEFQKNDVSNDLKVNIWGNIVDFTSLVKLWDEKNIPKIKKLIREFDSNNIDANKLLWQITDLAFKIADLDSNISLAERAEMDKIILQCQQERIDIRTKTQEKIVEIKPTMQNMNSSLDQIELSNKRKQEEVERLSKILEMVKNNSEKWIKLALEFNFQSDSDTPKIDCVITNAKNQEDRVWISVMELKYNKDFPNWYVINLEWGNDIFACNDDRSWIITEQNVSKSRWFLPKETVPETVDLNNEFISRIKHNSENWIDIMCMTVIKDWNTPKLECSISNSNNVETVILNIMDNPAYNKWYVVHIDGDSNIFETNDDNTWIVTKKVPDKKREPILTQEQKILETPKEKPAIFEVKQKQLAQEKSIVPEISNVVKIDTEEIELRIWSKWKDRRTNQNINYLEKRFDELINLRNSSIDYFEESDPQTETLSILDKVFANPSRANVMKLQKDLNEYEDIRINVDWDYRNNTLEALKIVFWKSVKSKIIEPRFSKKTLKK
jgi:hypothetical protein